ncbi:MAG: single-stranded DNA-binding protein [Bacteroidia bacterium]|nr:single-stranded DNA-binding protein [Bacteroidia bacterium]NNM21977.1 single-stranded DNA-binding protein [Flavobacteriaceae bacterium]
MNALRNKVQLIGRLGQDPEIINFEDGNKLAKFSMATDDSYKDKKGQKVERAYWHNVVVRGGLVNVVENYVIKGQEIAIEGKLTNRSYEDKEGTTKYVTEIQCNELLLLGSKA